MLYSQVPSSFQAGRDATMVVGSLTGDHLGCITQVLPLMHTVWMETTLISTLPFLQPEQIPETEE